MLETSFVVTCLDALEVVWVVILYIRLDFEGKRREVPSAEGFELIWDRVSFADDST
jgi:hypothetical protein